MNRVFQEEHGSKSEFDSNYMPMPYIEIQTIESRGNSIKELLKKQSTRLAIGLFTLMGTLIISFKPILDTQKSHKYDQALLLLQQLKTNKVTTDIQGHPVWDKTQNKESLLPPSPAHDAWMEELDKLPESNQEMTELLKVPIPARIQKVDTDYANRIKNSRLTNTASKAIPQLVGIIHVDGIGSSAIFQWGGQSTSVKAGEEIGSSGWQLVSSTVERAVIKRGGQRFEAKLID